MGLNWVFKVSAVISELKRGLWVLFGHRYGKNNRENDDHKFKVHEFPEIDILLIFI